MKIFFLFLAISLFLVNCKDKNDIPTPPVPSTLNEGLKAYYTFSGNVNDNSTSGINGAVSNASLTTDRFGNSNCAYDFNGSSSYIGLGNSLNNVFAGSGKRFSFSVWVKPNASMSNGMIIGKTGDNGCSENQRQFYFRILKNKVNFSFSPGSLVEGARFVSGNSDITNINKWYHIVMIYDGSVNTNDGLDRVKIYLDNIQETVSFGEPPMGTTLGDIQSGTAHLGIGNYLTSSGVPCQTITTFKGKIDDVRIYDRALTVSEIAELYNATK